jgi:MFS family permease
MASYNFIPSPEISAGPPTVLAREPLSILCGMAATLPGLVGARIIQGLGGAMMVPVGRLFLLRSVERSELVNALSFLTVPALLGPITGPLLGGFITTYFHWRWIFWINVPIGAAGLVLATLFIKDIKPEAFWPFDVIGFLLCGAGLALLLFGLGRRARPIALASRARHGGPWR